jgi:hypothetical protein
MNARSKVDRRGFLARGLAIAGASLLGGCDYELSDQPWVKRILDSAEQLTRVAQRTLVSPTALAREYGEADISRLTARPTWTITPTRRLPRTDLPIGNSKSAVLWDSRSSFL